MTNYIVVECKRKDCSDADFEQGIEQGFGGANALRSKFLLIDNFNKRLVYDVAGYAPNERDRNRIPDVPILYGLVPSYRLVRGGSNDLRTVSFSELASVFRNAMTCFGPERNSILPRLSTR